MTDPSAPTAIDGTRPARALSDAERLLTEARDPLLGQVIQDRYLVVRKLGEGGMGRVYEAEHTLVKRRVAIKCLHAQYASNSDVLGRFLREAQAAGSIGNEHIVDVLDMGRMDDGAPFMALEFLDGRDLADVLKEFGQLPIGRAVRVMRQVCDAVGAAHERGIVHRDLKPENVFLVQRGTNPDFVKVLDFGIAKFLSGEGGGARTGTGVMVGTPEYMSPEQIEDTKNVDHRADLYALGVILYTALAGRPPFRTESIAKLAYEVCTLPPPPIRDARPDLPPALAAVIEQLLAKTPDARIQSAREVSERLLPFADLDGEPVRGSAPDSPWSSTILAPVVLPPRKPRWWIAAAVLGVAGVLALAVAARSGGTRALPPSSAAVAPPTPVALPSPQEPPAPPPPEPPPPTAAPVVPVAAEAPVAPDESERGHHRGRRHPAAPTAGSAPASTTAAPAPAQPATAPSSETPTPQRPPRGQLLDINLDPQ
nr:serine/threonine protein kinase [Deltaproteobacteria bacterium]